MIYQYFIHSDPFGSDYSSLLLTSKTLYSEARVEIPKTAKIIYDQYSIDILELLGHPITIDPIQVLGSVTLHLPRTTLLALETPPFLRSFFTNLPLRYFTIKIGPSTLDSPDEVMTSVLLEELVYSLTRTRRSAHTSTGGKKVYMTCLSVGLAQQLPGRWRRC
jgi:hypothetical protein